MKDYKLKQRNLRASHTLALEYENFSKKGGEKKGKRSVTDETSRQAMPTLAQVSWKNALRQEWIVLKTSSRCTCAFGVAACDAPLGLQIYGRLILN